MIVAKVLFTTTLIFGIIFFFVLIISLVLMLLYAKSKLTHSGPIKITINDEKVIETTAGNTLLATLSNQKIFLPSACGGGGTCGMCKCRIIEGGGEILLPK